jgi:hypothetical protein
MTVMPAQRTIRKSLDLGDIAGRPLIAERICKRVVQRSAAG